MLIKLFAVYCLATLKCDETCADSAATSHGRLFHMHHHTACLSSVPDAKSQWTLWNASLTHVVNISERKTSESRRVANGGRAWINTFIYQQFTPSQRLSVCVCVYTESNCVLLYTPLHFLTGYQGSLWDAQWEIGGAKIVTWSGL